MYRQMIALLTIPVCILAHHQPDDDVSMDSDETEIEETHMKSMLAGDVTIKLVSMSKPVTLTCGKPEDDLKDSDIAWFYKSCGSGASDRPCDLTRDVGGQKMCRGTERDPCPIKLIVDKPQPGLYRCYVTGHKTGYTMTATLVNTYQLEIIERKLEPEFVELPEDVEAFAGSSALFMCRIRSNLPLHVRWYKQVPRSPSAIQYEKKYYQGLNTTSTTKAGEVYLSKLKLKVVAMADSGIFACGAVNEAGIQYREARLTVLPVVLQDPPHTPPGPWKMMLFGSAGGFLMMLMTSFCCAQFAKSLCGCRKSAAEPPRDRVVHRRAPPPRQMWTEPETSDYEHVVTL